MCQGISDSIALPLSCVSRMNAGVFGEQMCMIQGVPKNCLLPLSCVSRMNVGVFGEQMCMIQYRVSLKIVPMFEMP